MFVQLCLLAGCDYSDSIPGVGLMTAIQVSNKTYFILVERMSPELLPRHLQLNCSIILIFVFSHFVCLLLQAVIRFKEVPNNLRLKKICDYFKLTGKRVADTYLPRLLRAEQLFYYHPVFNPYSDSIAYFTEPKVTEGIENGVSTMNPDNLESTSGPCINEVELYRLGADPIEILTLRSSPSSSPNTSVIEDSEPDLESALTIRAVCRGLSSLKDGTTIVPRYPWEGANAPHQKGASSGWYMRKSLIATLGNNSSNNSSSSTGFGTSTKAASYFKSHTTTASLNYSQNNHNSDYKRNTPNSFALANISSSRPNGSSLFNMSKFALKTGNAESLQKKSNVLPYQLQQQLSQRVTNAAAATSSASKNSYFDSIELTTAATNNSLYTSTSATSMVSTATSSAVKVTSHHFQHTNTSSTYSTCATNSHNATHTLNEGRAATEHTYATMKQDLSAYSYTDEVDEAMVYDLCEDSPPAKKQHRSPVRGSECDQNNGTISSSIAPHGSVMLSPVKVSIYDVLDSPALSVAPVSAINNSSAGDDSAMALDLSREGTGLPQISFSEYLQSYKCSESSSTTTCLGSPSKLQMLLSPSNSNATTGCTTKTALMEPNATTKKSKDHRTIDLSEPDTNHDRLLSTHALPVHDDALHAGRRKTLGAAPFVPIQINHHALSGSTLDKRKAYTAVPIARKKTTKSSNSTSTGTIMVASIKSFFNAV